jgi:hypothetical protein
MRRRGDSSAGQPGGRPRDQGGRNGGRRRGHAGKGSADDTGHRAAEDGPPRNGAPGHGAPGHGAPGHGAPGHGGRENDQSVFVPGYRSRRSGREAGHQAAGPGTPGAGWPASSADVPVGKGAVRGFPPAPGQPPPLYPPGQFAAWNRMSAATGDSRAGTLPGTSPGTGAGDGDWAGAAVAGQPGQPWYGQNEPGGQAYEPGYSALAVSDPAADVTSTQTWRAIGDGRDGPGAGAWADPRGTAVQVPPGREPWGPERVAGGDSTALASPATGSPAIASPATASPATEPPATEPPATGSRPAGSRTAAREAARAAGSRGGRSGRKGGSSRKGRRSPGPVLAVCAVLILALAAGTFLLLTVRHQGAATAGGAAPTTTPPTSTPTPSPTLGPFGHIASRTADPLPLTITQLFPHTFAVGSASYVRAISQVSKSCTAAVIGTALQSAVQAAKCNQVVRASYLSTAEKDMGTIGVLNLSSAAAAEHAGRSAGAADFIAQLKGHKGATHELGKGTGIEEAAAKGHYLILIWVQFTSRAKPKTAAERAKLEAFMNDLFQQTANISLSSRMVDGTP